MGDHEGVDEPPARFHAGHGHRQSGRGENRLPPAVAVVTAVVLYALLPSVLVIGPRYLVPVLEVALLAAVGATNPRRLTRQSRLSRIASLVLVGVIIVTNLTALGFLVDELVNASVPGKTLLVAALQVWATNVIAFALLFWSLDRGGPVARGTVSRPDLPLADFRFSHDEDRDTVVEVADGSSATADWAPTFIDYLYVSTTNSSAFSPTDTMPLTSRAKIFMGIEATAALLTSLLVIAKAVGTLK
jgi:hypothetical protein